MATGFRIGGLLFILPGAALLYFGLTGSGDARLALTIIGATFLPCGLVFFWIAKKVQGLGNARKLREHGGIAGKGTITSIVETRMRINYTNPVFRLGLLVEVPGWPPYQVEIREAVPCLSLGAIAPGRTLAVWVDPSDPQTVAVDFSMQPAGAPAGFGPSPAM
jgi:hypothetical protein